MFLLGLFALLTPVRHAASAVPAPAGGEPLPSAATLRAQIGWSGWIPLRAWLPVRVELQASVPIDGEVAVDVPVQGYDTPLSFRRIVRLVPGASQRIVVEAFVPDARGVVAVRLVASGREVTRQNLPLSTTRAVEAVVLALTREPAGLEFLSEFTRKIRAVYVTEADLPDQWQGYAGVQMLVLRDFNERAISPAQQRALEEWVIQGGRLLVTGGSPLATLQAPWLLRMLPADPEALTDARRPDDLPGLSGPVSVTALRLRRGAAGGPLNARWHWGAGSVLLWGFDPFAPALRSWSRREAMWAAALEAPVRPLVVPADMGAALPAGRPLACSVQVWLLALSLAYILAVRRVLRLAGQSRGGWLSVPVVAALFVGVMYGFALQARRAGTSVVEVSIAEVIPGTAMARVRTFAALISPYGGAFRLQAAESVWMQLPEPHPLTFSAPFSISGMAPASGLRLDATEIVPMSLHAQAAVNAAGLRVEIDNPNGPSIDDARIVRGGQIYRLPRIGATLSVTLDPTRWEPFTRQANPPADVTERFIEEVVARLQRQAPDSIAWLVGRLGRGPTVGGPGMRVDARGLVIVPLRDASGGGP